MDTTQFKDAKTCKMSCRFWFVWINFQKEDNTKALTLGTNWTNSSFSVTDSGTTIDAAHTLSPNMANPSTASGFSVVPPATANLCSCLGGKNYKDKCVKTEKKWILGTYDGSYTYLAWRYVSRMERSCPRIRNPLKRTSACISISGGNPNCPAKSTSWEGRCLQEMRCINGFENLKFEKLT